MKEEWFQKPTNLVELFEDTVKKFGKRNFLGTKNAEGVYEWLTYKEIATRVDNLRGGLAQIGVGKDDAVGLIINNSVEWAIIAFATYGLNAKLIPMYEKELEKVWKYIVMDSQVKVLFAVNDEVYEKVKSYKDESSALENIYVIRGDGDNSMAALEKIGQGKPIKSVRPHWSDIAGLIYTSGTTGDPKGVLLSHGNFTSNVRSARKSFYDTTEKDVSFAILPWAHSFGQTGELYYAVLGGSSIGLMESTEKLTEDLPKVKPTYLIAVPRIFNKVYDGVHAKLKAEGKLKLLELAKASAAKKRNGEKVGKKDGLITKVVFKKIRALFGGNMRFAVTGSAVMNPDIAQFFIDVGIPTYDCYGLTETSPGMTCNSPSGSKLGTVGVPIENVTVKIDKSLVGEDSEDGEIVCYGPNVMQGYYNKPEKTAEVFVEDSKLGRGFKTGDRGKFDEDGYLLITGRFKEEYKLENGKYVHPASLEEDIKLNPLIANAMIYGDGKKFNVALIVPNFELLEKHPKVKALNVTNPDDIVKNAEVKELLIEEINTQLKDSYGGYEIPKKFIFITEDFTLEKGYLTQTFKLKRRNVLQTYGDQLNALY